MTIRFYTTAKIGPRREMTPEGFLICYDVPISRLGTMQYGASEVPVQAGSDGIVHISRDAESLFSAKTIASFQGKPVVNDHPDDDVTPDNWADLAIGSVLNPRRNGDVLEADLIITDKEGIRLVISGKVEVSCGYDADYEETGTGTGRQINIIGNHLALVDQGRCGPRCSIGDTDMKFRDNAAAPRSSVLSLVLRAFTAKTADDKEKVLEELAKAHDGEGDLTKPEPAVHVHVGNNPRQEGVENTLDNKGQVPHAEFAALKTAHEKLKAEHEAKHKEFHDRIHALEEAIKKGAHARDDEMPEGVTLDDAAEESGKPKEEMGKARDSVSFADAYRRVVSEAEVIAPGIRLRTFDGAALPAATMGSLLAMRRDVLAQAASDPRYVGLLMSMNGNRPLEPFRTSFSDARRLTGALAAVARVLNNNPTTQTSSTQTQIATQTSGIRTPADLNKFFETVSWE
jgi:hypothetical protein